ncbi:MAG: guanylate kinase [Longimicrobiales bacterium]
MNTQRAGIPLVIAAPSGAGKTSLARELVRRNGDVVFALSATTRPARPGETHDADYRFVDDAEFGRLLETGKLLEWAVSHGMKYGTLFEGIDSALAAGRTVVLDIDVQGARQVRDRMPGAVLVFVLPPSAEELLKRLTGRASETAEQRRTRMTTASSELAAVGEFDYVVVNDDFEKALVTLEAIIEAETHRASRLGDVDQTAAAMAAELNGIVQGGP